MIKLNMRSAANAVKSQGVGSCYDEQVKLVKNGLKFHFDITENKRDKFDIVHYHTVNLGYFIERYFNKAHTVGIGYVHFLPDTLDESLKLPSFFRKMFYRYLLAFYNSMDYLVTVNPYFVRKIKDYGILKPKVAYIPNFVSSEFFRPMSKHENVNTRNKFKISLHKFVVLCVGQLQTRKGVLDFIETAKLMPDVQFVWAGGFSFGRVSDGYEQIKKILQNPPENVLFLGIVDRMEMPAVYNMADVMFLPSFEELFPMAILEALCCKKPVIIRDIPLYDEILFDYCIKAKDILGFAKAISEISNDAQIYDYWCKKSWQCHNLYSEENALGMWKDFYTTAYAQSKTVYGENNGNDCKAKKRKVNV